MMNLVDVPRYVHHVTMEESVHDQTGICICPPGFQGERCEMGKILFDIFMIVLILQEQLS